MLKLKMQDKETLWENLQEEVEVEQKVAPENVINTKTSVAVASM